MTIFNESDLQFKFSDKWWIVQYDNLIDYKKLNDAIEGSKAVDFIGVLNNNTLALIEVKNFRGHRIETKPRVHGGDDPIELEVARKVRDTLAGIVAASRHSTHLKAEWRKVLDIFKNTNKNIEVILWLEEDLPPQYSATLRDKKMQARGGTLTKRLQQKLEWLTQRVFVCNISENDYKDTLMVSYL